MSTCPQKRPQCFLTFLLHTPTLTAFTHSHPHFLHTLPLSIVPHSPTPTSFTHSHPHFLHTLPPSLPSHTPTLTSSTLCSTLQHTATHCNTLQHSATHSHSHFFHTPPPPLAPTCTHAHLFIRALRLSFSLSLFLSPSLPFSFFPSLPPSLPPSLSPSLPPPPFSSSSLSPSFSTQVWSCTRPYQPSYLQVSVCLVNSWCQRCVSLCVAVFYSVLQSHAVFGLASVSVFGQLLVPTVRFCVCCTVLQCVAVCCSVLQCIIRPCSNRTYKCQCVAVCCSVLQCVAVFYSVLQHSYLQVSVSLVHSWCDGASFCVVVCCSVLQCVAVCCSVLQCVAVCCSVPTVPTVRLAVNCSLLQFVAV